eukprot:1285938-Rhodomonas_salina.1
MRQTAAFGGRLGPRGAGTWVFQTALWHGRTSQKQTRDLGSSSCLPMRLSSSCCDATCSHPPTHTPTSGPTHTDLSTHRHTPQLPTRTSAPTHTRLGSLTRSQARLSLDTRPTRAKPPTQLPIRISARNPHLISALPLQRSSCHSLPRTSTSAQLQAAPGCARAALRSAGLLGSEAWVFRARGVSGRGVDGCGLGEQNLGAELDFGALVLVGHLGDVDPLLLL